MTGDHDGRTGGCAAVDGKRHQRLTKLEISIITPASQKKALDLLKSGLERLIILGNQTKGVNP